MCAQLTEDDKINQGTQRSEETMDNQEDEQDPSFDSLIKDMNNRLRATAPTPVSPEGPCVICWVNELVRAADSWAYTPSNVLIGALHRNPSHWMEQEKKNRLYNALPSGDQQRREQVLRRYLEAMADVEVRARRCYNDDGSRIKDSEAFACMLLLDGYFVLSSLELTGIGMAGRSSDLYDRDVIFLLENQLPFFVLVGIYGLLATGGGKDDDEGAIINNPDVVAQDVASYIERLVLHHHLYVHDTVTYKKVRANLNGRPPCHLLHLLYLYFRPTTIGRRHAQNETNGSLAAARAVELNITVDTAAAAAVATQSRWRSATYYYAAGVRLAKRELDGDGACSILDIDVRDGTLHIPCLRIDGNTTTILRNMMALEVHSHGPGVGTHVLAYCHFLSQVASTEEDVRLLSSKGIIDHCLSKDSDVADGFAGLCRGIVLNMRDPELYYLKGKQEELEKLCRSHWRKSMAWLRHTKCNNILMALAVAAAVIVFLCTVEQSLFAALSYATGKS